MSSGSFLATLQAFFIVGTFLLAQFLLYSDINFLVSARAILDTTFVLACLLFTVSVCFRPGYVENDY